MISKFDEFCQKNHSLHYDYMFGPDEISKKQMIYITHALNYQIINPAVISITGFWNDRADLKPDLQKIWVRNYTCIDKNKQIEQINSLRYFE